MALELKQVKAFVTIATVGSMSLAAQRLNITPSGLSRLIARLEEQIQAPLFERHSSGVSLTEYGKTLMPHAQNLLNTAKNAQSAVDLLRGAGRGIVRIGAVASAMNRHVVNSVSNLLSHSPALNVELTERVESELFNALLKQEIDIAIGGEFPKHDDIILRGKVDWHDTIRIVARPQHPVHSLTAPQLTDLLHYAWIMPPPGSSPMNGLSEIYKHRGLAPPTPKIVTPSVVTIKNFLLTMDLLTWMPAPLYALEEQHGLLKSLDIAEASTQRQFFIYSHHGVLTGAAMQMIACLKQ